MGGIFNRLKNLKKTETLNLERVYWILFSLFIVNKLLVFFLFSTQYIDQDQTTMWLALVEMANGNFHEPCFWGQSYNTMLESFLAVPLYHIGIKPVYSVTFVTLVMASFPFLYGSRLIFKHKDQRLGIILLFLPLITTVDYDLITGMPRGWVTGQFIASFGFWSFVHPERKIGWLLFGFSAALGIWLNPNSVFISFIIGYYLFFENKAKFQFYFLIFLGTILPVFWVIFSRLFYINNPEYTMHPPPSLGFSFPLIIDTLPRLDVYFGFVAPFIRLLGWISLILIPVGSAILFRNNRRRDSLLLIFLFMGILASLSMEKTADAFGTIFFSGSRFFIGYPFILAFVLFSLVKINKIQFNMNVVLLLVFSMSIAKSSKLFYRYGSIELVGKKHWVSVDHISAIENSCREIKNISDEYYISLIVFRNDPEQLLSYGCPCLIDDFPLTVFTWYERRTWVLQELDTVIHSNILLVNPSIENSSGIGLNITDGIESKWGVILLNNSVPTNSLLQKKGYQIRPH